MTTSETNEESPRTPLPLYRHPAAWLFAVLWVAAMSYLVSLGHMETFEKWTGRFLGVLLLSWLTVRVTQPPPDAPLEDPRWKLWLSAVLVVIAILRISRIIPWWCLPGIETAEEAAGHAAKSVGLPYTYARNPTAYFLIPLLLLFPITGLRHLGLARGHRTWQVIALWLTIPVLSVAAAIISGSTTIGKCSQLVVRNTMNNGPWEEFLFRGALQTRLMLLLGNYWGVVLASLLFGIWHFAAEFQHADGSIAVAFARTLVMQSVTGLAFGIIYGRTRNLAACSVCHVAFNVFNSVT